MQQFDFRSAPILLLGKDPDMLGLLREVLLDAGFFVIAKLSEGVLLNLDNSEDRPGLIIYDECAPEMDAERVFYLLQDSIHWCTIPFVILSDICEGPRIARCLDRGITEFVDKPFDVDELAARVRKILRTVIEDEQHSEMEGFAGDLAYMNLADLLLNLHQNRRTGELIVSMDEGEYHFTLVNGSLANIEGPSGIKGRKALFRAMRFFYGKFIFTPLDEQEIPAVRHDYGMLPNLILSAVQESDEYPLTRKQLPPEPQRVALAENQQAADVFSGDFRILHPLLQNPARSATIDDLVIRSPKTDFEAVAELQQLYEKGILVDAN